MAKAKPKVPAEKLAFYDKIVDQHPDATRKGAANVYTSVNGHMFSFMDETGRLSLRLEKAQREAFLVEHDTSLSVQHNTVMKEYVLVPDSVLQNDALINRYFSDSYDYVSGLKPKPTRKKK